MHVYFFFLSFLYINVCTFLSIYLFIYLSIYLSICLSIYISIYLSIYIDIYISMYIYIYVYTCIYIYIYIYMYIYIYIYITFSVLSINHFSPSGACAEGKRGAENAVDPHLEWVHPHWVPPSLPSSLCRFLTRDPSFPEASSEAPFPRNCFPLLLYYSRASTWVKQKSMSLKYESSSEPLRISAKLLFLNPAPYQDYDRISRQGQPLLKTIPGPIFKKQPLFKPTPALFISTGWISRQP